MGDVDNKPDTAPDFARLNEPERTILILLAKGHTAKSIANMTSRSVAAVNERLREARRKTGFASSRELARQLAAQENRDEIIGVDLVPTPQAEPSRPTDRRSLSGVLLMTAAIILASAAAWHILASQNMPVPSIPQEAPPPTLLDPTYWNDRYWHGRFASETRDTPWASRAEAALRAKLETVPDFNTRIDQLRARCARTACEVSGRFVGEAEQAAATLEMVQDVAAKPVERGAPPLTVVSFSVEVAQNEESPAGFLMHFRRDFEP